MYERKKHDSSLNELCSPTIDLLYETLDKIFDTSYCMYAYDSTQAGYLIWKRSVALASANGRRFYLDRSLSTVQSLVIGG
jgi:hypothetical protein